MRQTDGVASDLRRRTYAWAWLRCGIAGWWDLCRRYRIFFAVGGVLGASLLLYRGANHIALSQPWNWHKRKGGPDVLSGVGESLWFLGGATVAFLLWSLLCGPYRLAKAATDSAQRNDGQPASELGVLVQSGLDAALGDTSFRFEATHTSAEGSTTKVVIEPPWESGPSDRISLREPSSPAISISSEPSEDVPEDGQVDRQNQAPE